MASLAKQAEVHLLTCFSASVPDPEGFALACQTDKGLPADVDYMAIRRQEDAQACEVLGVHPHYLPLPEAPHRGYQSAEMLFGGITSDDLINDELRQNLEEFIGKLKPDMIFYPLGIGDHVDHLQVIRAVKQLAGTAPPSHLLQWYDEPYLSKNPGLLPEIVEPKRPEFLAEWLPDTDQPDRIVFDISALEEVKFAACGAYKTQLDFQFGGKDQIAGIMQKNVSGSGIQLEFVERKISANRSNLFDKRA
jgi:LmbE family N-acetylglucosaminyl deacetylase